MEYRGYVVDFEEDPENRQFYTILDGERIEFGENNMMYHDDCKKLIDAKLDTISRFTDYPLYNGARLT